jgi:hypothetical protein
MSRFTTNQVVEGNWLEHPAVLAWADLRTGCPKPDAVVILKEHPRQPWKRKSAVYRLEGVGPNGSDVLAKRCRLTTAALERTIYEKILPSTRVPALHYYGAVEEPNGEYCWLFLEYIQGQGYSSENDEHRTAAARWLGQLHASTLRIGQAASLPDRGPKHYLRHLESGHDHLEQIVGDPAVKASDAECLRSLIKDLDLLRSGWTQIERFCSDIPSALAHGDFVPKNIRVRATRAGLAVVPFAWETSGWGPPVADLGTSAYPELDVYWHIVRPEWPDLSPKVVRRMSHVGRMFRVLATIDWQGTGFSFAWPDRSIQAMDSCQTYLRDLLEISPWNG